MKKLFVCAIILASLLSLALFYFLLEKSEIRISEIDESWIGKIVTVKGKIISKREKNGHIFLVIEDESGRINVPLFRSFLYQTNLKPWEIKIGRKILVKGVVKLYKNSLEVVPSTREDVKLL